MRLMRRVVLGGYIAGWIVGGGGLLYTDSFYTDSHAITMTIEEVVKAALYTSDDLERRYEEAELAELGYRLGARRYFPQVDIGYTRNDSVTYRMPDIQNNRLTAMLSQPLFVGMPAIAQRQGMKMEIGRLGDQIRVLKNNLIVRAIELYLLTCTKILHAELLDKIDDGAQRKLQIVEKQYELGVITQLEALEQRLAVAKLEVRQEESLQQVQEAQINLGRLVGIGGQVIPQGRINTDYDGILEQFGISENRIAPFMGHTELASLYAELQRMRQERIFQGLLWIPKIDLVFQINGSGSQFPFTDIDYSVGLKFDFGPPLNGMQAGVRVGQLNANNRFFELSFMVAPLKELDVFINARRIDLRVSQVFKEYTRTRHNFQQEVAKQFQIIENQRAITDRLSKQKELVMEQLEIVRLRSELGEVSVVELLDAEQRLIESEVSKAEAIIELCMYELQLMQWYGVADYRAMYLSIIDE